MENTELQRITRLIVDAMRLSTDPVTAVGAENVAALPLETPEQATHLARCIAAFTTDDALSADMIDLVGESPKFLTSKVLLANYAPEQCTGEHAELEKQIWRSLYAGRRERKRVAELLVRRCML